MATKRNPRDGEAIMANDDTDSAVQAHQQPLQPSPDLKTWIDWPARGRRSLPGHPAGSMEASTTFPAGGANGIEKNRALLRRHPQRCRVLRERE